MKRTLFAIASVPLLALALAACGHKQQAAQQDAEVLPAPDAGNGSVTGMPAKPGPGQIGTPAPASPQAPSSTAAANPSDALPPNQPQGIAVGEQNPAAGNIVEPGPDDALQLVRDYYAAIATRDYGTAWHLWSDGGAASRQTLSQFANGFADTTEVRAQVGDPGDEDAGAGQRYIEVPVTVTATHADGSRHRYAGSYVLHRTVVDGASAEQRAWRISSAKLRETTP